MVKVLNSSEEYAAAIKGEGLIVVDFFATWCGPCKVIVPLLEKLDTKLPTATFFKVDVDQLTDVAKSEKITAMPTIILYKEGKEIERVIGADPNVINRVINANA